MGRRRRAAVLALGSRCCEPSSGASTRPFSGPRSGPARRIWPASFREELEEAEAFGDSARAERPRAETDALTDELSRGFGLGGRARRTASTAERSRVNVTRFIKRAIESINAHDPELGRHLRTYVRTGTFCAYEPDPRAAFDWAL